MQNEQKIEETASSSSSSSSSFLEEKNNIVDLTELNVKQLKLFHRLIEVSEVDDLRHVCINRIAFKHLIGNLDETVEEEEVQEEVKEEVEEETKEEVEEETKEESVSSSSSSSFSEEIQSDDHIIIDLTQLNIDDLGLFHSILEIADEVDDLRHVRVNKTALKHLFDNLDEAVEEEEEVEKEVEEEVEKEVEEEVKEEVGKEVEEEVEEKVEEEETEESISPYFSEEFRDNNIIIDLTRIRVDELSLFYRLLEIADEKDDLKHVSINRIAFDCLIYNFDEGLDEEEED